MFEALVSSIMGSRIPLPPHLPPEMLPSGVVLRSGKFIPWLGGKFGRMKGPAAAVTIARTIIVNPEVRLSASLLAHELTHVRQFREDPFFWIKYGLATLRYGYRENPYEQEARDHEHTHGRSDGKLAHADVHQDLSHTSAEERA